MSLSISSTGLALIKKYEGCKLSAYQDSAGVWTIGYGHTSGVNKGQTITKAQADAFLKADCAAAENAVNSYSSIYKWNQNQFDALVSFTFNCGSGNLKKLLNSGKRTVAEISSMITAYDKANGKVLQGLVNRRAEEKKLFDTVVCSGIPSYRSGRVYTLQVDKLNVRKNAGTGSAKVTYANLTANAKANAYLTGQLKKGTKITCKTVKNVDNDIWLQIPSGWIAGYYNGKIYVK